MYSASVRSLPSVQTSMLSDCIRAGRGPVLSSSRSFSAIRIAPPEGSRSQTFLSRVANLFLGPVVQNAAEGKNVRFRQGVGKKVTRYQCRTGALTARLSHILAGSGNRAG